MLELEAEHGAHTPLLLHGDLEVIDADGVMVAPSFWDFKSIDPAYGKNLPTALMHPTVTGCTAVLNHALLERVRDTRRSGHDDRWIGLVAAAFGQVGYDPQPRISYRIHGSNVSAPKSSRLLGIARRAPRPAEIGQWVDLRIAQAELFLGTYGDDLDPEVRRTLEDFAAIRSAGPWRRRRILWEGGFRSPDMLRTVAMYAFV